MSKAKPSKPSRGSDEGGSSLSSAFSSFASGANPFDNTTYGPFDSMSFNNKEDSFDLTSILSNGKHTGRGIGLVNSNTNMKGRSQKPQQQQKQQRGVRDEAKKDPRASSLPENNSDDEEDVGKKKKGKFVKPEKHYKEVVNNGVLSFIDEDEQDEHGNMHTIDKGLIQEFTKKKKKGGGFQSMDLLPHVFKGVMKMGYKMPTPVQRKAIPIILEGSDIVAMARTGSGKTAAFCIPLLQQLDNHAAGRAMSSSAILRSAAGSASNVRAVILSPTRELAMQTCKVLSQLGRFTDLRYCMLVGGQSMEQQFELLSNEPDVIIATPGRLVHHLLEVKFTLTNVKYVVFDEADRLFEMGFATQLMQILSHMSEDRQTCLFSATMPKALAEFSRAGLRNPIPVRLDTESKISPDLEVSFFTLRSKEKLGALHYLLNEVIPRDQQAMVFVATRHHVEFLETILRNSGISTTSIYGHLDAEARKNNIEAFRDKQARVMVVTDLAARGIDIPLLDNVINFDFPAKPKLFIHRTGRVARANRSGTAYSFVSNDEMPYLLDLYLFFGWKMPLLPNDDGTYPVVNPTAPVVAPIIIPTAADLKAEKKAKSKAKKEAKIAAAKAAKEAKKTAKTKLAAEEDSSNEDDIDMKSMQIDMNDDVIVNEDGEEDENSAYADEGNPNRVIEIGRFPAPILDSEAEYVRGVIDSADLHNLERVTNNGYKMYHKTRESASSASSRRWKDMITAPIHPIFFRLDATRAAREKAALEDNKDIIANGNRSQRRAAMFSNDIEKQMLQLFGKAKAPIQTMDQVASYDAALQSLSTFTPKQTIFELLQLGDAATMKNKRLEHDRVIIKNIEVKQRPVMETLQDFGSEEGTSTEKTDTAAILKGMIGNTSDNKKMKKGSLMPMTVDLSTGMVLQPKAAPAAHSAAAYAVATVGIIAQQKQSAMDATLTPVATTKRLSVAERRKRKRIEEKLGDVQDKNLREALIREQLEAEHGRSIKRKRGQLSSTEMKDQNYISLKQNVNDYEEAGYAIHTRALDAAVMDLGPEDNTGLLRSKKVEKWDQRKRRFVTTYEKQDAYGKIKKNESGKFIKADKKEEGQMYAEWQRRSKKTSAQGGAAAYRNGGDDNDTFETEATTGMGSNHNKIEAKREARSMGKRGKLPTGKSPKTDNMGKKITSGIVTIDELRKMRKTDEKNKARNAKKKK